MTALQISNFKFIFLNSQGDLKFADTIEHCSSVDRICIRRMLADFRELRSDKFRLLMGTYCYFFRIPQEIIAYTCNSNPERKVLYMIDNLSTGGKPYRLRYYRPEILGGLHGDFYCLAPGVTLQAESIKSCLKIVDDWPLSRSYLPDLPKDLKQMVFPCEQQAASMLLGQFPGKMLSPLLSNHMSPRKETVLLHTKKHG